VSFHLHDESVHLSYFLSEASFVATYKPLEGAAGALEGHVTGHGLLVPGERDREREGDDSEK